MESKTFYEVTDQLLTEIRQREEALAALELVYFGQSPAPTGVRPSDELSRAGELVRFGPDPRKPAEKAEPAKKSRRGSKPRKKKATRKGKSTRKLSQTPSAKAARAWRKKKAAEAAKAAPAAPAKKPPAAARTTGKAHSAHDALTAHSEAETEREASGPGRPGNALIDRKKAPAVSSQATARPPASSNNKRRPSLPPVKKGSLTGLTQRNAIKAVLRRASRQLNQAEILDRLLVGGYQFRSENPKSALSVALATMRGELQTETRAGLLYYDPIKGGELE